MDILIKTRQVYENTKFLGLSLSSFKGGFSQNILEDVLLFYDNRYWKTDGSAFGSATSNGGVINSMDIKSEILSVIHSKLFRLKHIRCLSVWVLISSQILNIQKYLMFPSRKILTSFHISDGLIFFVLDVLQLQQRLGRTVFVLAIFRKLHISYISNPIFYVSLELISKWGSNLLMKLLSIFVIEAQGCLIVR